MPDADLACARAILGRGRAATLLGGPDCNSLTWSFLDLTLPEWSLLAFLLLAALPLSYLLAYRFRTLAIP